MALAELCKEQGLFEPACARTGLAEPTASLLEEECADRKGTCVVLRGFPGGLDSASVGCGWLSPGPGAVHSSLSTLATLFTDAPPSSSAAHASPALYSLVWVTHIRNFGHRSLSFAEPVACCPPVGWQLRGLGHSTKGKELLEEN